jgi:sugar/nucleoside kinase (ribokinase family)
MAMAQRPLYFTLGMFILDEIHHSNPAIPSQYNIIGGGGTFGALGARIVTVGNNEVEGDWQRIKLIVDQGSDFPAEVKRFLDSWTIGIVWRLDPTRLTTRGWNFYHDGKGEEGEDKGGTRDFEYVTEKKRIEVSELDGLDPEALHLLCPVARARDAVERITGRHGRDDDTVLIFEPVPYDCIPGTKELLFELMPDIDILSPNAKEAAGFFGLEEPLEKEELESLAERFLPCMSKRNRFGTGGGALVLRCGALGCYTLYKTTGGDGAVAAAAAAGTWYPPYHTDAAKIVDPTGCGNTFVGSFVTGFVRSGGDYAVASVCGSIASGVCIEQLGMPSLEEGVYWNGESFEQRMEKYLNSNGIQCDMSKLM